MRTSEVLRLATRTCYPAMPRRLHTGASCRRTPLTDRLAVTQDRLKNWGRWARDENPHIWYPTSSSGFGAWIPDGDDEGHADADGAKEAKWTAPDRKDAELIDVEIMKIGARHV